MLLTSSSSGGHSALVRTISRQPLLFDQFFDRREVLHRVRVAEEDQGFVAVRVAVEALLELVPGIPTMQPS